MHFSDCKEKRCWKKEWIEDWMSLFLLRRDEIWEEYVYEDWLECLIIEGDLRNDEIGEMFMNGGLFLGEDGNLEDRWEDLGVGGGEEDHGEDINNGLYQILIVINESIL